jgi:gluconolactonase
MKHLKLQGEVIATGLRFPEGPIAMPDGSVIVVELEGGTLTRVLPNGHKQVVAEPGGGPNGAALGPDGHVYVCNNGGFSWRTDEGFTRPTGPAADYTGGSIQRVTSTASRSAARRIRCSRPTASACRRMAARSM